MFITFEGIDYSGKTTQAKMLQNYLTRMGQRTILIREPGGTKISEKIRKVILNREHLEMTALTEFLLFSASRAQLVNEVIKPNLKRKVIVICDRYYDSSTAYQGHGGDLNLSKVKEINDFATGGLNPDITFFIDIPTSTVISRSRGKKLDRIENKKLSFYRKVRRAFLEIAGKESRRFVIIDGRASVNQIHLEVLKVLNKKIKNQKLK